MDLSMLEVPASSTPTSSLDPITVFWQNYKQGQGKVTIVAGDAAWSYSFWAMPEDTIQTFFAKAGIDYLVNKLGNSIYMKKNSRPYLWRVVEAIKNEMTVRRIS